MGKNRRETAAARDALLRQKQRNRDNAIQARLQEEAQQESRALINSSDALFWDRLNQLERAASKMTPEQVDAAVKKIRMQGRTFFPRSLSSEAKKIVKKAHKRARGGWFW